MQHPITGYHTNPGENHGIGLAADLAEPKLVAAPEQLENILLSAGSWVDDPTTTLVIAADGGSRGNPGIAGSGTVIMNQGGETIHEYADFLGDSYTNNYAEYRALINGLRFAVARGAQRVVVRMDSKLVVEQLSGRWKIKNADMQQLALIAKKLERKIGQVDYLWVPREQNKRADALANAAMDFAEVAGGPALVIGDGKLLVTGSSESFQPSLFDPVQQGAPAQPAAAPAEEAVPVAPAEPEASQGVTTLVLIRHGEAQGKGTFAGDEELTATGKQQLAAVKKAWPEAKPDVIVSSALRRAVQSTQLLFDQEPQVQLAELNEIDFGSWTGKTGAEIAQAEPAELQKFYTYASSPAPNGESVLQVAGRSLTALRQLAAAHAGKTIAVTTHSTVIKLAVAEALQANFSQVIAALAVHPASVTVIKIYPDGAVNLEKIGWTAPGN